MELNKKHRRIRRLSMDEFYSLVTGQPDAFYQICMILPSIIEEVVNNTSAISVPVDTVIDELKNIAENENGSFTLALYILGFSSYNGFSKK